MSQRRLIVAAPMRNASHLVAGWFSVVEAMADEVIVLDDGSTDATAESLRAHPLVSAVLINPERVEVTGWDDNDNRTRLLNAVAPGDWLLFLDADERLIPGDATRLRALVDEHAEPGFAYGFQVHRTTDDLAFREPDGTWVYRLFQKQSDQEFPQRRLHFPPIPTTIPRRRWLRTSIKLLHVTTESVVDRRQRIEKYRLADPDNEWQASYEHLLDDLSGLEPVGQRSGPLVLPVHQDWSHEHPSLSVVVISVDDEDLIEDVVRSVVDQALTEPFEVILVTSGSDGTATLVRDRFPSVSVVELDEPALPGRARNAGLERATGDFVAFLSSHGRMIPGSLQARLDAHREGWALVTGPVVNGNPTRAGWASYFMDHSSVLPGRPDGALTSPPVRCSYVRFVLDGIGGFPPDIRAGEDTHVNLAAWDRGYSAYLSAGAAEVHTAAVQNLADLARKHHARGRSWAAVLTHRHGGRVRAMRSRWWHLLTYGPQRMMRIHRSVGAWGTGLKSTYWRVVPVIAVGVASAWVGLIRGMVGGSRTSGWGRTMTGNVEHARRGSRVGPGDFDRSQLPG